MMLLAARSAYSMCFGTMQPESLVQAAKDAGYDAVALTDRNGVYGVHRFIEACRDSCVRPILGTELVYQGGRAILLAKDRAGFSSICRLLTDRAEGKFGPDELRAVVGECGPQGCVVLTDDLCTLRNAGAREDLFALVTPCNRHLWRALAATGHRVAGTEEVSFLRKEDRALQRLLVAIGGLTTVADVPDEALSLPDALLAGPESLRQQLRAVMESAIEGNRCAGEMAALDHLFEGFVFPSYAAGHKGGAAELLRERTYEGAAWRYGEVTEAVRDRIEYELSIIEEKGFSDYFLVVKDIARRASRTCGRGSAAASIVSYCLGITDVDPIRHDLYFERFLNPGRVDPPDIDVDFAWDERDALLASVIEDFGEVHTARVSNHVCFQERSALRETARAYGMPDGEISAFERRRMIDPSKATEKLDESWAAIARIAPRLVGLPRNLSVHSGGLIIVPDKLADHVPIEKSGSGIRVTVWDKEGVENAGLVKIDLLGNRSLAVVRDALANLCENGIPIDEDEWRPIDDPATVDMLARGDTMGVFYVESPAMKQLQMKAGVGDFEHLVIHSSMIRPAANKYISEYLDRLHGKPWKPLHPLLAGLFAESFGILCYQEDVSKAAIALSGFSAAKADGIRKVLSKKDAETRLQRYWPDFEAGAGARGVDGETIAAVWDMIRSFSGYSFVKAHSASYAMLSFKSAYLRRHHPAEFMAAVISNHGGYYSTLAYTSEARRMGIAILPPCVNESELRCRGKNGNLRFGLEMIKGLRQATAEAVVDERSRHGPYASVANFGRRIGIGRDDAEALIGAGALDNLEIEHSRADKLMELFALIAGSEGRRTVLHAHSGTGNSATSMDLFEGEEPSPTVQPRRQKESERQIMDAQMRYLGTTLERHPLELFPKLLARKRTYAKDLSGLVGRQVELLSWPITAKPVLTTHDEVMEFVSFEDETAIYEAVLFPDTYRKFRHLLFEESKVWVRGKVGCDRGAVSVEVWEVRRG